jgi:hypothetical protein
MKKSFLFVLIAFISAYLCLSCEKESAKPVIDPALQVYYDSFMREAKLRNKTITGTEGIKIQFGSDATAYARAYMQEKKIVVDSLRWKNRNTISRETTIFHELGHLLLFRDHELSTFSNGEYKSLMLTYENITNPENFILNIGMRRKYYIDELFNANTSKPDWFNENFDPFPQQTSTRKLLATQDFDESKALSDYLLQIPNAQYNRAEKGLLNVKLPKGFGFLMDAEKVMEMASIEASKRTEVLKSSNYEIEVRYRLKSGVFNFDYSPNSFQNQFTFSHNFNPSTCTVLSIFHGHNFGNYTIKPDFNTIRLIRKNGFWSVYRNDKHLFYSDVLTPEQADKILFFISGKEENAEFDLDYFKIYTF